jgi:hypothetical protein
MFDISFDGVVLIYDSNWYIKCPNNIEIDKQKQINKMRYFGPLSHYCRQGELSSGSPLHVQLDIRAVARNIKQGRGMGSVD